MKKYKDTQLISLSNYCPKSRLWDKFDIIYHMVNIEDQYNHKPAPIIIPKMEYHNQLKPSPGLWNFFTRTVEAYLP